MSPYVCTLTTRKMSTTSATPETELPTVEMRPDADVVIFDGRCRMCTAQIRRLTWWDCQGHLAYASLHAPWVAERYPDLTHEMLMDRMYIVDQQGRRHGGAAAVRYLSRRLRRLWWAAPLLHFPGSLPVWRFFYDQIARRRYRFGVIEGHDTIGGTVEGTNEGADECESGTCELHRR